MLDLKSLFLETSHQISLFYCSGIVGFRAWAQIPSFCFIAGALNDIFSRRLQSYWGIKTPKMMPYLSLSKYHITYSIVGIWILHYKWNGLMKQKKYNRRSSWCKKGCYYPRQSYFSQTLINSVFVSQELSHKSYCFQLKSLVAQGYYTKWDSEGEYLGIYWFF